MLELLVVVALLMLLLVVGVPSLQAVSRDAGVSGVAGNYLHAFNSARYAAVAGQRAVSMCDLREGACSGAWRRQLTIFYDDNRDGRLAAAGDIVDVVNLETPADIAVTFRAFGTTRYLHVRRGGYYRQNGTFRFCPAGGGGGRAIVINVAGRARAERIVCGGSG
ncbi:MAG: GspH/FimT family protein [Pseudomonadota bacterium]